MMLTFSFLVSWHPLWSARHATLRLVEQPSAGQCRCWCWWFLRGCWCYWFCKSKRLWGGGPGEFETETEVADWPCQGSFGSQEGQTSAHCENGSGTYSRYICWAASKAFLYAFLSTWWLPKENMCRWYPWWEKTIWQRTFSLRVVVSTVIEGRFGEFVSGERVLRTRAEYDCGWRHQYDAQGNRLWEKRGPHSDEYSSGPSFQIFRWRFPMLAHPNTHALLDIWQGRSHTCCFFIMAGTYSFWTWNDLETFGLSWQDAMEGQVENYIVDGRRSSCQWQSMAMRMPSTRKNKWPIFLWFEVSLQQPPAVPGAEAHSAVCWEDVVNCCPTGTSLWNAKLPTQSGCGIRQAASEGWAVHTFLDEFQYHFSFFIILIYRQPCIQYRVGIMLQ